MPNPFATSRRKFIELMSAAAALGLGVTAYGRAAAGAVAKGAFDEDMA